MGTDRSWIGTQVVIHTGVYLPGNVPVSAPLPNRQALAEGAKHQPSNACLGLKTVQGLQRYGDAKLCGTVWLAKGWVVLEQLGNEKNGERKGTAIFLLVLVLFSR